jgi:hypothetical protein
MCEIYGSQSNDYEVVFILGSDATVSQFSTLTKDAANSSETLVMMYQTKRHHIPEGGYLASTLSKSNSGRKMMQSFMYPYTICVRCKTYLCGCYH